MYGDGATVVGTAGPGATIVPTAGPVAGDTTVPTAGFAGAITVPTAGFAAGATTVPTAAPAVTTTAGALAGVYARSKPGNFIALPFKRFTHGSSVIPSGANV